MPAAEDIEAIASWLRDPARRDEFAGWLRGHHPARVPNDNRANNTADCLIACWLRIALPPSARFAYITLTDHTIPSFRVDNGKKRVEFTSEKEAEEYSKKNGGCIRVLQNFVAKGRVVVMWPRGKGRREFFAMPRWMYDFIRLSDTETGRSPPFVSPLVTLAEQRADKRPVTAGAALGFLTRVA
jgi:hypothetical protein